MFSELKKLKNIKGKYLILIGISLGIILIIFGNSDKKEPNAEANVTGNADPAEISDSYVKTLESRVKLLIESMDGVSDVNVIITPDSTVRTVYAENAKYSGGDVTEKDYVLKKNSGEPVVLHFVYPKLRGVAVVCRGGSNPIIQEKIVNALCALFDLSSSHVYVSG